MLVLGGTWRPVGMGMGKAIFFVWWGDLCQGLAVKVSTKGRRLPHTESKRHARSRLLKTAQLSGLGSVGSFAVIGQGTGANVFPAHINLQHTDHNRF